MFTKEELKIIHDRITVEKSWGESVYSKEDLELMDSILNKSK